MKKWIFLSLFAASTLFADEISFNKVQEDTFYLDIGSLMLPVPVVGGGFRYQAGRIGVDASIKSPILILPMALRENLSLLYYPQPNLKSQLYMGVGITAAQALSYGFSRYMDHNNFFGPGFVFGHSYHTDSGDKRFWQISTDIYFEQRAHRMKFVPLPFIGFSYGFGF